MSVPDAGKYPATLAEALAVFQANPPRIGKGNTAEVKNDQGKKLYEYSYADLADVNEEVLPRLGAVGLAFTARPTIADGQFVLAYSLIHVSGEREDGVYPLQANLAPQKIGGLITYARRYCLCAVTGIAAAGDDDDAGAAQAEHRQSAGDVFENAATARPRAVSGSAPRGQVARPVTGTAATEGAGPDESAQEYADEAHVATTAKDLEKIHEKARTAGKVAALIRNPATGKVGQLALYLDWRRKQVKDLDDAWREFNDAAGRHRIDLAELEIQLKQKAGVHPEAATAAQLREFVASLDGAAA